MYTIVQNVSLVIESTFFDFNNIDHVICRSESSKSAGGFCLGILQNTKIIFMTHVLLYIMFLDPFRFFLRLFITQQTVHFGSYTDKLSGWQ